MGETFDFICYSLNMTAMSATALNPGMRSPYEVWHGRPPNPWVRSFLQPVVYHTKWSRKSEEHGRLGYYVDPAAGYPSGTCTMRAVDTGFVVITRDMSCGSPCLSPESCDGEVYKIPSYCELGIPALERLPRLRGAAAMAMLTTVVMM